MKGKLFPVIAALIICIPSIMAAQTGPSETAPQPAQNQATESAETKQIKPAENQAAPASQTTQEQKVEQAAPAAQEQNPANAGQKQVVEKKALGGPEIYFDVAHLNLFNYGIGFVFGFEPVVAYGFSGILGYRHLNTFKGFPGMDGGTRAALDLFIDAGANIASVDGESVISGFASFSIGSNIMWFKSLAQGNNDRTGHGRVLGAKVEGQYSKLGFLAGYGPAIGWTMVYYNTEKKKFRTTNVFLWFYPPTMTLGVSATTSF